MTDLTCELLGPGHRINHLKNVFISVFYTYDC